MAFLTAVRRVYRCRAGEWLRVIFSVGPAPSVLRPHIEQIFDHEPAQETVREEKQQCLRSP